MKSTWDDSTLFTETFGSSPEMDVFTPSFSTILPRRNEWDLPTQPQTSESVGIIEASPMIGDSLSENEDGEIFMGFYDDDPESDFDDDFDDDFDEDFEDDFDDFSDDNDEDDYDNEAEDGKEEDSEEDDDEFGDDYDEFDDLDSDEDTFDSDDE